MKNFVTSQTRRNLLALADQWEWPMHKPPEDFAEQVKNVRQKLALSQEELAHALGVSFATVNRWENGKTMPSKLALRQFEQFFARKKKQGDLS